MLNPIVIVDPGNILSLLPKKSADLRPQIEALQIAVKSQGGRGTCSVFASTFLIEYMISKERGLVGLDLSEEYLNAAANMSVGAEFQTEGDGDFFHGVAAGYEQFGVVDEMWFPYRDTFDATLKPDAELQLIGKAARFLKPRVQVSARPEKIGLTEAQLTLIREQLDAGVPVATGYHGASNITTRTFSRGVVAMDDEPEFSTGEYAHSVALVGYAAHPKFAGGGGYFIFRNSGGPDWGAKGYGFYTFDFARKFVYDFAFYRRPRQLPKLSITTTKFTRPKIRFSNREDLEKLGKIFNAQSRVS